MQFLVLIIDLSGRARCVYSVRFMFVSGRLLKKVLNAAFNHDKAAQIVFQRLLSNAQRQGVLRLIKVNDIIDKLLQLLLALSG